MAGKQGGKVSKGEFKNAERGGYICDVFNDNSYIRAISLITSTSISLPSWLISRVPSAGPLHAISSRLAVIYAWRRGDLGCLEGGAYMNDAGALGA